MAEETLGELIEAIRAAVQRMAVNNPHRALFARAGTALIVLTKRVAANEQRERETVAAQ